MTWMGILAASAWKGTIVLAAAFAAAAVLRRQSASFRHFLWMAAFAGLLVLPAAIRIAPRWNTESIVGRMGSPLPRTSVRQSRGEVGSAMNGQVPWLLWLWAAGMFAAAARFATGAARTSWMARRAEAWPRGQALEGVRVLLSDRTPVPLAWGLGKPVVLLPAQAREWPEERLRMVLTHEGEHVRRHDLAAQLVAQAACALYWFHPLAWWALREFRKERERACDDAVLARGAAAHEYAGHLVDVLREAAARRNGWADAPAMAEPTDFESRVKALLDPGRNRRPLSRRAAAMVAAAVVACVLPVAMVHAQSGRAALAGVVTDPSGARVPGCKVVAKNADGSHEEVAVAGAAGEYSFASIPAGEYALEFLSRGFAIGKSSVTLVSGAVVRADMQLEIGRTIEHVAVTGPRSGPAPAPRIAGAPQRIRVGGNVTPAKLIRQTRPVFPDGAPEGSVVIRAVVSKDGSVLNPVVINTVDPRLARAALDAVSQWVYQPTLLNGEPVEMVTTVTVDFQLSQ
jgi:beta-lactamase regulating signal transducer with metallopeptidase domain